MMDDQEVRAQLPSHPDGCGAQIDRSGNAADLSCVRDLEAVPGVRRIPDGPDIEEFVAVVDEIVETHVSGQVSAVLAIGQY
jgi:hypothetical protein